MSTSEFPPPSSVRSIPSGFVKERLRVLKRPPLKELDGRSARIPSEIEVVRVALQSPDRLDELASKKVDLRNYPGLIKRLIEHPRLANLDQTLSVLKKHGLSVGWPELRHASRFLKTPDYLTLLKHGPSLYGDNAADQLASCISQNETLTRDILSCQAAVNIRPRLLKAVSSIKPELAKSKADALGMPKPNPFFSRNQDTTQAPGFDRGV